MKDLIGIERGRCLNLLPILKKACPCPMYKVDAGATRGACNICECPSVMHEEVPDSANSSLEMISPLSSVLSNDSGSSGTGNNQDYSVIVEVPNGCIADLLAQSSSTSEPTSDEIEGFFPKKFSKKVEVALASHKANANHKNAIIRTVTTRLHEEGKASNTCLQKAAKKMQLRWSPFKNPLDPNDSTALYQQLRKKRDKLNTAGKEGKDQTEGSSEMTAAKAKLEAYNLWIRGNRNHAEYSKFMPILRPLMIAESRKCSGPSLFKHYPYLELKELMLTELSAYSKLSELEMENNWSSSVPHLISVLKEHKIECSSDGTVADKTVTILSNIHLLPVWYQKKNAANRAARILEVFPVDSVIEEIRPGLRDPPRLLAMGKLQDHNFGIYCYLDTSPFFSENDPVRGLLLLLASYLILNVSWPTHTRLPLQVIVAACLGPKFVARDLAKNNKVVDLLKVLKLA